MTTIAPSAPGRPRLASFDTEREVRYTRSEGGVVCPRYGDDGVAPPRVGEISRPDSLEIGHATVHELRCPCSDCRDQRATIRAEAYAELTATLPARSWARRPWDGPLANFPGTTHDDTTAPKRVRRHPASEPRFLTSSD